MLHCLQTNILGKRIHNCLLSKMSNVEDVYTYFYSTGNCSAMHRSVVKEGIADKCYSEV